MKVLLTFFYNYKTNRFYLNGLNKYNLQKSENNFQKNTRSYGQEFTLRNKSKYKIQ